MNAIKTHAKLWTILLPLFAIALIFIISACGGGGSSSSDDTASVTTSTTTGVTTTTITEPTTTLAECATTPMFQYSPVDTSLLSKIVPIGRVSSTHIFPTPHMYFYVQADNDGNTVLANVLAPMDIIITKIDLREYFEADAYNQDGTLIHRKYDYAIDFDICLEMEGYFIHLATIDDKLSQIIGSFNEEECSEIRNPGGVFPFKSCDKKDLQIAISSGEVLGTIGGVGCVSQGCYNIDVGIQDFRFTHNFINNDHYQTVHVDHLHAVCILDYMSNESVKTAMQLKVEGYDSSSSFTDQNCGTTMHDVAETIQGNWFNSTDVSAREEYHIALVPQHTDATQGVLSIGNFVSELESDLYYFSFASSGRVNRKFSDVTADNQIYCYEATTTTIEIRAFNIQLIDDTTLRIEQKITPNCDTLDESFSNNFIEFIR